MRSLTRIGQQPASNILVWYACPEDLLHQGPNAEQQCVNQQDGYKRKHRRNLERIIAFIIILILNQQICSAPASFKTLPSTSEMLPLESILTQFPEEQVSANH